MVNKLVPLINSIHLKIYGMTVVNKITEYKKLDEVFDKLFWKIENAGMWDNLSTRNTFNV